MQKNVSMNGAGKEVKKMGRLIEADLLKKNIAKWLQAVMC